VAVTSLLGRVGTAWDTLTVGGPSGTVTFLFTDIEGSTRLWETAPGEHVRSFNTTVLIGPDGRVLLAYRKTHLYDAFAFHESDLIVAGNMAKFGQHPDLREFLLGTGDRVLVEASPRDRIWGIGLAAGDERATSPDDWLGLNLLGFALMEVRHQLRDQDAS